MHAPQDFWTNFVDKCGLKHGSTREKGSVHYSILLLLHQSLYGLGIRDKGLKTTVRSKASRAAFQVKFLGKVIASRKCFYTRPAKYVQRSSCCYPPSAFIKLEKFQGCSLLLCQSDGIASKVHRTNSNCKHH